MKRDVLIRQSTDRNIEDSGSESLLFQFDVKLSYTRDIVPHFFMKKLTTESCQKYRKNLSSNYLMHIKLPIILLLTYCCFERKSP